MSHVKRKNNDNDYSLSLSQKSSFDGTPMKSRNKPNLASTLLSSNTKPSGFSS